MAQLPDTQSGQGGLHRGDADRKARAAKVLKAHGGQKMLYRGEWTIEGL